MVRCGCEVERQLLRGEKVESVGPFYMFTTREPRWERFEDCSFDAIEDRGDHATLRIDIGDVDCRHGWGVVRKRIEGCCDSVSIDPAQMRCAIIRQTGIPGCVVLRSQRVLCSGLTVDVLERSRAHSAGELRGSNIALILARSVGACRKPIATREAQLHLCCGNSIEFIHSNDQGMAQNDYMTAPPRRRWVLHVDMDQFIAAVEVQRNPDLAGKQVVVGGRGDPTERGVVSTASYEARAFGVGSGMPLRVAVKKLPDAVFLPVDGEAYTAASNIVMEALRSLGVVVEVMGWDEAFLGVETEDPVQFARKVHDTVFDASGLHCSVGIGDNKLRAKTATDFGKPQGIYTLTAENWFEVMGERSTEALWGIGKKTAKKLATLGITTVSELAAADDATLAAAFGPKTGPWIGTKGRGVDHSPVSSEPWIPRSHSRETTFQQDLENWDAITEEVRRLSLKVREDLVADDRKAVRVTLKVRYAPFETHTTTAALTAPTFDPDVISDAAAALIDRLDRSRKVRLMGVRLEMTPPADQTRANSAGEEPGT